MMYHKINSIFKRRMETKEKLFILGEYADPAVEYLKDNEWEFTEKIDGTNVRVILGADEVKFGGRTENAQMPMPLIEHLQSTFTFEKLQEIFRTREVNSGGETIPIILFGEGCGWRIQKGGGGYVNNEKRVDFILFDIAVGNWWLRREDVINIANELDIRCAPVIGHGTIQDAIELVSGGFKSTYGDFIAEGIVARPTVELKDRGGNRIITKIKYRDFKHLNEANKNNN